MVSLILSWCELELHELWCIHEAVIEAQGGPCERNTVKLVELAELPELWKGPCLLTSRATKHNTPQSDDDRLAAFSRGEVQQRRALYHLAFRGGEVQP